MKNEGTMGGSRGIWRGVYAAVVMGLLSGGAAAEGPSPRALRDVGREAAQVAMMPGGVGECAVDFGSDFEALGELFSDQYWRLNHLYTIRSKQGVVIRFKMNWAQRLFYFGMHNRNIILKARQLGFTTFMCIFMLDQCLWNSHVSAGIVADNEENAIEFMTEKIQFAYEQLAPAVAALAPAAHTKNKKEFSFSNGSKINVGVSLRSSTCQILLVSEFGKICAESEYKAAEIISGTLPTVPTHGLAVIESTAHGREGRFFNMCETAQAAKQMKRPLSPLGYKFFFFPWWAEPAYRLDHRCVVVPAPVVDYARALDGILAARGLPPLHPDQVAWYAQTWEVQESLMTREYPGTPEEAFASAIDGTYYSRQMQWMREKGRICSVPHDPSSFVNTWWDIGMRDYTAIIFTQTVGREVHVIDYYEMHSEGFAHYAKKLEELKTQHGYRYRNPYGPHDLRVRELMLDGESRLTAIAARHGMQFEVVPKHTIHDGVEAVRSFLPLCWIDAAKCSELVKHLCGYKKKWNPDLGVYHDRPRHDEHSHGADAMRYLAMGHDFHGGGVLDTGPLPLPVAGQSFI